jgi:hypothetical protein
MRLYYHMTATLFQICRLLDRSPHGMVDIDSVFGSVTRPTWSSLSVAMEPVQKRKPSFELSLFLFLGVRHVRTPVAQLRVPGYIANAGTHVTANA